MPIPRSFTTVARRQRLLAACVGATAGLTCLPAQQLEPTPHWAFVAPERRVPALADPWCGNDVDRCVLAGLRAVGRQPAPPADPALLLRRLHHVLTGLPPTIADVDAFVADPTADDYERRVDALLRSDACAEHLASSWLDLARFADTYGYQSDFVCRTWPWRDWLLRSFAQDKPWDRFVAEIVAGDLLPDATTETRTATAFWRLHRQTNEGGSIDEEWRHEYIADRVDTFGSAFLGLTVGCARCHDHKSDPITQRDYYALGSFFAIDEAGLTPYSTGGIPRPSVRLASPEQDAETARLQAAEASAARAYGDALRTTHSDRKAPREPVRFPEPIAHYPFDASGNGATADERRPEQPARVPAEWTLVPGHDGHALQCDGDGRMGIPGVPAFSRDDAFSLHLRLSCSAHAPRAVVLHTSNYTEDADTQGYQILLRDGHVCWELVHHWPGAAIAVRSRAPLPKNRWVQLVVTYDGSSRASGLGVCLDGEPCPTDVVRDQLDGPATVRRLELGGRDRDNGFAGGAIDDFRVFAERLSAAQVALLADRVPGPEAVDAHHAERSAAAVAAAATLREARRALHRHVEAIPELMVMAPHPHPPERFVLRRGAYDQPDRTQPVTPDAPAAVLPFGAARPRDRRGLAAWLNDPQHPLAARVVVDRLWARCFGRGLVATPDNFGVLGDRPQQQVLLDALAVDFQRHRSVRALLRTIVCSATFRQSSTATPADREADPDNRLLARGPTFRLSAEALRDQALFASGLLQVRVGGPSVRPWQPPGLWGDAGVSWGGADYKPDDPPNSHRRSLYTFRKRTAPPPNMAVLDAPSREVCTTHRQSTDTPLQALAFLNDPVFTECADALAARAIAARPDAGDDAQLVFVFRALASRPPRQPELAALRALAANGAEPPNPVDPAARRRALSLVASTVMASDAAVMLR